MALAGLAIPGWHSAQDLVTVHLGLERTSDTAMRACRRNAVLCVAEPEDGVHRQRRGRAGFNAGAARDAFGVHQRLTSGIIDVSFGVKTAACPFGWIGPGHTRAVLPGMLKEALDAPLVTRLRR